MTPTPVTSALQEKTAPNGSSPPSLGASASDAGQRVSSLILFLTMKPDNFYGTVKELKKKLQTARRDPDYANMSWLPVSMETLAALTEAIGISLETLEKIAEPYPAWDVHKRASRALSRIRSL